MRGREHSKIDSFEQRNSPKKVGYKSAGPDEEQRARELGRKETAELDGERREGRGKLTNILLPLLPRPPLDGHGKVDETKLS